MDSVVGFGVLAAAPDAPVAHDPTVVSRSTLLFSPCPNCEASLPFFQLLSGHVYISLGEAWECWWLSPQYTGMNRLLRLILDTHSQPLLGFCSGTMLYEDTWSPGLHSGRQTTFSLALRFSCVPLRCVVRVLIMMQSLFTLHLQGSVLLGSTSGTHLNPSPMSFDSSLSRWLIFPTSEPRLGGSWGREYHTHFVLFSILF